MPSTPARWLASSRTPSIENILKNCPVKIGGGKQTVMLYDLMPNMVVQDFMSICERYADDL
jgi:hypothetical protein